MGTTTTCQVCKHEQSIPEAGATPDLACAECGALLFAAPGEASAHVGRVGEDDEDDEDEPTMAGDRHARRPARNAPQRTLLGMPPMLPIAPVAAGRKPFAATFAGVGPRFVGVGLGGSRAGALLEKPKRPEPEPLSPEPASVEALAPPAPPPPRERSERRALSGAPPPPPPPRRRTPSAIDEEEPLDLSSPGLSNPRIPADPGRRPGSEEEPDGGLFADLVRRDGAAAKGGDAARSPGLPTPPRSGPSAAALVASTREGSEASGPLSPRASSLRSAAKLPPPPPGAPPPPPTTAPAAATQRAVALEEEEGGFSLAKAAAILGAVAALVVAVYFLNAPSENPAPQPAGGAEALAEPAEHAEVAANTVEPVDSAQAVEPVDSAQAVEPAASAQAAEPAENAEPAEDAAEAPEEAAAQGPATPASRPATPAVARQPGPQKGAKETKPSPKDEPPAPASKAFDRATAMLAMGRAAGAASGCATDVKRSGMVSVTFLPTGSVASVSAGGELAGSVAAACVESKFRAITVPPFEGEAVTTFRSVTIHPE